MCVHIIMLSNQRAASAYHCITARQIAQCDKFCRGWIAAAPPIIAMPNHGDCEAMDMRKARSLVGMPVVCEGRRVGRVLRADLSGDLTRMEGVWVGAGIRPARYIPSERLQMLGRVAVMADCGGERKKLAPPPLPARALSTDGQRLGAVTGAEVDELTFRVASLELSGGVWDDLFSGRQRITDWTVNPDGEVVIDANQMNMEGIFDEERIDEGASDGHADRRLGGDDLRGVELADRAEVEPKGAPDGQLDQRQGG